MQSSKLAALAAVAFTLMAMSSTHSAFTGWAHPLATSGPLCGEEATEDPALAAPGGVVAGWNGDFVDLTWEDATDEACYVLVIVERGSALDEVDRRVESPDADTTLFTEHRSEYDESGATRVEFEIAAVYGDRRSPFATADLSVPPLEPITPSPGPLCGEEATEDAGLAAPTGLSINGFDANGGLELTWDDADGERCYLLVITERGPALDELQVRVESPDADVTRWWEHGSEYMDTGATNVLFELAAVYGDARSPFVSVEMAIPQEEPITPSPGPLCGEEATEDAGLAAPTGLSINGFDANGGLELTWDDADGERCYLLVITERGPALDELQVRVESPDADVTRWWEHGSEYLDTGATNVLFELAAVYGDARSAFVSADWPIPPLERPTVTPTSESEPESSPTASVTGTPTPALLPDTGDEVPRELPLAIVAALGAFLVLGGAGIAVRMRR